MKIRRCLRTFGYWCVLRGLPLTMKVLALTSIMGIIIWIMLDYTENTRQFFFTELAKEFEVQARDDRALFDQYIRLFQQTAEIITSQQRFHDYLMGVSWQKQSPVNIQYYYNSAPWLPAALVMQSLFFAHYALLLDDKGQVREIYRHVSEDPPASLTESTRLLEKLSRNQTYITVLADIPYALTLHVVEDENKQTLAILLLVLPLDDEFFKTVLSRSGKILSLINGNPPKVLASNHPEFIPTNTLVSNLTANYLMIGKSHFDYVEPNSTVKFASFIAANTIYQLVDDILHQTRRQRLILLVFLLGTFLLSMAWMTWHLRKVTYYMMTLSENYFGIEPRWAGDEIMQIFSSAKQLQEGIEHTIAQANAIAAGNYHYKVNLFSEQDQLGRALFNMTRALRQATIQNEQQHWLKTGQTQLHEHLRGEQDLVTLTKNIIVFLTIYVDATAGKLYLVKPPNLSVKLFASHGYILRSDIRTEYELGEGLAGQVALEQQNILWTHIPKDYRYHQPVASDTGLENLFAMPFYCDEQLKGVIELNFSTIPTEIQCEFLEQVMPSLGVAINMAESRNCKNTVF